MKTNGYSYSRAWFDFAFETDAVKPVHTALFFWIVELNNRLGWKEQFGLPTLATMEALRIGNKRTYLAAFNDLVSWNFIEVVSESKNQYTSAIIKICRGKNATAKVTAKVTALDTALIRHCPSIDTSTAPIDKQRNKETKKPRNNETRFTPPSENDCFNYLGQYVTEKRLDWSDEKINQVASRFFNYYETVDWFRGKVKIKNWHSAMRNWVGNNDKFENSNTNQNGKQSIREARQTELERFRAEQFAVIARANTPT